MNTLHRMIIKDFIPTLLVSLTFFLLILEMVDLFGNLWRYLNAEVSLTEIARVSLLYIPKCISFSLPISILFSISYILGNYYANNELIAVFGAGYSLYQLTLPLIFAGLLISLGGYYFEDRVVIPSFKEKNDLSALLLGQSASMSNSNVTVLSQGNRVIYNADFYNDKRETLTGITVLFSLKRESFSPGLTDPGRNGPMIRAGRSAMPASSDIPRSAAIWKRKTGLSGLIPSCRSLPSPFGD